jgi:hypothetical protein
VVVISVRPCVKAVADLFGHSSIAITGGVYGHTSDDTARAAVDGLAERLGLLLRCYRVPNCFHDATPTRVWLTIVDEVREESG